MLVKFCLEWYFKLYFDIKVKHLIVDAPLDILTSLLSRSMSGMLLPPTSGQGLGMLTQNASCSHYSLLKIPGKESLLLDRS